MIQGSDLAVVDIGNTSAKVAMCIHNELKVQSIGHQQSDWEAEVARFPTQLHDRNDLVCIRFHSQDQFPRYVSQYHYIHLTGVHA